MLNQSRRNENHVDMNTFGWIRRIILAEFHIQLKPGSLLQTIFQAKHIIN